MQINPGKSRKNSNKFREIQINPNKSKEIQRNSIKFRKNYLGKISHITGHLLM
jgi:hypothetical protein